jgi:metallophosphoesterase superfamily enzyme
VCDPRDDDGPGAVVHGIDDAVVADPHAVVVSSSQLLGTAPPRVDRKSVDRRRDAIADRAS